MVIERLIEDHARRMADAMPGIAGRARSHDDIRIAITKLIDEFLEAAGITEIGWHEYGLAGGRVDSLYGGVVVEYKSRAENERIRLDPDAATTRSAVEQVISRFGELEQQAHIARSRVFGIGCDAEHIFFVTWPAARPQVDGPHVVTTETMKRVLRALVSVGARGRSFTPDELAAAFGFSTPAARTGVRRLYELFSGTENEKARTLFSQWRIYFGDICGHVLDQGSPKSRKLAEKYELPDADPAQLLFALHTYYAILMKLVAGEVAARFGPVAISVLRRCVNATNSALLRDEMKRLEDGGIWREAGITNFLEGDIFGWYVGAWDSAAEAAVRAIVTELDQFDPATLSVAPEQSRDLLKGLYQNLFPRELRHDLGEYYTPDWLADLVLDRLEYGGDPSIRILDPACGSGTFLVLAINRIKRWFREHRLQCGFREDELIGRILRNVVGFDVNPLAVLAARTNYLLATSDLIHWTGGIEIPVYLCDSVQTPRQSTNLIPTNPLRTAAATFEVPIPVGKSQGNVAQYTQAIEHCLKHGYSDEQFQEYCEQRQITTGPASDSRALYKQIESLHNRNGIWARIIKNSFAPLFTPEVDLVVGNPPWVNWESLSSRYRSDTLHLWEHYGLRGAVPIATRQRSDNAKTDVAILMCYVAVDQYLREGGRLGFVLPRSLLHSELGGWHFRRFMLPNGDHLRVDVVDDVSTLRPFAGRAENQTVLLCLTKGEATKDCVRYVRWCKRGRQGIDESAGLGEVLDRTQQIDWVAFPTLRDYTQSAWFAGQKEAAEICRRLIGPSDYASVAREGINTRGANGVFFVDVLGSHGSLLEVQNRVNDGDDTSLHSTPRMIEDTHVYPLLKGEDVGLFKATPRAAIVLPHDAQRHSRPIPFTELGDRTQDFLEAFKCKLRSRSNFRNFRPKLRDWHGLWSVLRETFAQHRVVWREIKAGPTAAVVHQARLLPDRDEKTVVPDHKLMLVPTRSAEEAHYVAGVLNSSIAQYIVRSFTLATSQSLHILDKLPLKRFDRHSALMQEIAQNAIAAEQAGLAGDDEEVGNCVGRIDDVLAQLWGLGPRDLQQIQEALREL